MNGKGRLIHINGDYYEGDWVNGKANGAGKYVGVDGNLLVFIEMRKNSLTIIIAMKENG